MLNRFYAFFKSQKCFSILSLFFAAYLGAFFLDHFWNNPLTLFLQIIGGMFFLFFGTGMSLVLILQWLFRRKFDLWEFVSLSLISSLLVPPFILTLEFSLLRGVDYWYPLVNSLALWCAAGVLLFFNKTSIPLLPSKGISIKHPLLITLLFGIIFILIQVLSFQALPDLDPYAWLFKYVYQFANHLLDYSNRPLFGSFIYITTTLTGISIFNIFKYVLPFLFLLTLFPAWMVARTFQEKSKQWLFLLFVFTSPVIILYAGTAMPQMPLIIISYFFVLFLLYSFIKKDDFFLYAAGASMFLAFFCHEAASIIFIAWIIPVMIAKRKIFLSNKKTLFFIIIILLFNLYRLRAIYDFATHWARDIIPNFFKKNNLNLLYPAQYTNTDRNAMGWDSLAGVIKFYSFYIGPILGLVLLGFVLLLFQKKFRAFIFGQIKGSVALFVLLFSFASFFIIAEIFPRFPNIALLPDRAWVFCGIFAYIFLFTILQYIKKIPTLAVLIFLLFFTIGISGTLYINYLKRYLISPMQLQSAQWIKSNLPDDRIFLSFGHKSLLPVHAETPVVKMPASIYCSRNISDFQKFMDIMDNSQNNPAGTPTMIGSLKTPIKVSAPIPNGDIFRFNSIPPLDERPLYIYYSQMNLKNPYRGRPYSMTSWGIEPCPDGKFLFDNYPEKFKRIYADKDKIDEVVIWKILTL